MRTVGIMGRDELTCIYLRFLFFFCLYITRMSYRAFSVLSSVTFKAIVLAGF
jgi:hypothetical protein